MLTDEMKAALTALIEHAGEDGVTEGDIKAAQEWFTPRGITFEVIPEVELADRFARHRATAFAAGKAAREREIVEWLRGQADIGDKKANEAVGRDQEGAARAYIGGMLALKRAADAIERGEV